MTTSMHNTHAKEVKEVKDHEEWALRDVVAATNASEVSVKVTFLKKLFKVMDDDRKAKHVKLFDTQFELDESNKPPESTTPPTPTASMAP